jgi:hypothetical protein
MRGIGRCLVLTGALVLMLAAAAGAQTVVVRRAPAGAAIELRWNEKPIATGTAGADGNVTLAFPAGALERPETDARVFVDVCEAVHRVTLLERALQPSPPDTGCRRTEVGQFVLLRPATSLLVDLEPASPTLWVRQGPVPPEWLLDTPEAGAERPRQPAPTGLIIFADGGFTNFSRFTNTVCGTLDCDAKGFRPGYSVGAAFWLSQYFGVEGGFLKPSDATATAEESTFSFDSSLESQVITAAALVGIPVGRVRFYGRGGATHHRATLHTTQTFEPRTVTIGGVQQTIEGGTQELELRTAGWGWLAGGGLEGWVTRRFAIYGEANYGALKGGARDDGEGEMDERISAIRFGIRIRLGG